MHEQALKLAGQIGHPVTIAAVALAVAASVCAFLLREKRPILACAFAGPIIFLGVVPLYASHFLQSRGVYHVHVVLLRPDQSAVEIAQIKSSTGGELRIAPGGWELDIPPQSRPGDGKVTFTASVKDEFMKGTSALVLGQDYYPTATVQLVAETSAMLRGVVVDEDLRAIAGATVSIDGNSEVAVTDQKGNFVLPAHAGKGQIVEVEAQKDRLTGHLSAPAGKTAEIILSSE